MTMDPQIAEIVESVIHSRRSVRRFTGRIIEREVFDRLIRAGIAAPSGSNWQNQRFLVIDNAKEIDRIGRSRFVWPYHKANQAKIRDVHPGGIVGEAAALIIVFSDSYRNDRRGNGEYYIWQALELQNCAAAIQNMLLMATSMGLGSCWISASDTMNFTRLLGGRSWRQLLEAYQIPITYHLQGIVMLGYPRSVDESGFPKGETMHGATIWQSTARREIQHYIVESREGERFPPLDRVDKLKVRLLSGLIRLLLRLIQKADIRIHRLEVEKYLVKQDEI